MNQYPILFIFPLSKISNCCNFRSNMVADKVEIRQNFNVECEKAINEHINLELHVEYTYLSLAFHFNKTDVALNGMHKYFLNAVTERKNVHDLCTYMNKRGGHVQHKDIQCPVKIISKNPIELWKCALELEKKLNENLLKIHVIASQNNDVNFCDFLETRFLQNQVNIIRKLATHIANLERIDTDGVGIFLLDKQLKDVNDFNYVE